VPALVCAAAVAWAPGAGAATSPVEDLMTRCPTAGEVALVAGEIPFTFDADPTGAGCLVCTAAGGSANLTLLQKRAFQAVLAMHALGYAAPLPFTRGASLAAWFTNAVTGVRFREDIADDFCCDPAGVIDIKVQEPGYIYADDTWMRGFWGLEDFVEPMVREARLAQGFGHSCGANDATIGELGPWGALYYLDLWNALYSGPFLSGATAQYNAFYRDGDLSGARQVKATHICDLPKADLALLVSAPTFVVHDTTFPYTLTVRNNGPDAAPAVFVYSPMVGAMLVSTDTSRGSCHGPYGGNDGPIGCSLGAMRPGEAATIHFVLRAGRPLSLIANSELTRAMATTVEGSVAETVPGNNSARVQTEVVDDLPSARVLSIRQLRGHSVVVKASIKTNGPRRASTTSSTASADPTTATTRQRAVLSPTRPEGRLLRRASRASSPATGTTTRSTSTTGRGRRK
jgi:uncharacterized protein DUF11